MQNESATAERQHHNARYSPPNLLRSVTTTLAAFRVVLNLPTFIIIVIAALDSADKGLLASSFPMLEKQLGMSVDTLGYFSLFTNLSYSFALPLWGWCVHRYSIKRSPSILAGSCALWGASTLGIAAAGSSVGAQALFRAINGGAVASILPLRQMLKGGRSSNNNKYQRCIRNAQ